MAINKQDNGNTQLNTARCEFNDRVAVKKFLGSTKRVTWNGIRRYRTI